MFDSTPDDLDMHVIYDVSHNIAKVGCLLILSLKLLLLPLLLLLSPPAAPTVSLPLLLLLLPLLLPQVEEHLVEGRRKRLLVHRKGSTRAFPPHHPLIPVDS